MATKKHHWQNLSLKNIKGERWKYIPGLDDCFQVSDYGRIKRMAYETEYTDGRKFLRKEKIIKPAVVWQYNTFKKDYTPFVCTRVTLEKTRHNFTLARLLYYCFVKKWDMGSNKKVVICKDGNGYNLRPANLQLVSWEEKQQRTVSRGRFHSPFHDLTPAQRKQQRRAIAKTISKPVEQYTLSGKLVRTYSSMAEAQRVTGVFSSIIGTRAAGKGKTAGGFIWKWKAT